MAREQPQPMAIFRLLVPELINQTEGGRMSFMVAVGGNSQLRLGKQQSGPTHNGQQAANADRHSVIFVLDAGYRSLENQRLELVPALGWFFSTWLDRLSVPLSFCPSLRGQ